MKKVKLKEITNILCITFQKKIISFVIWYWNIRSSTLLNTKKLIGRYIKDNFPKGKPDLNAPSSPSISPPLTSCNQSCLRGRCRARSGLSNRRIPCSTPRRGQLQDYGPDNQSKTIDLQGWLNISLTQLVETTRLGTQYPETFKISIIALYFNKCNKKKIILITFSFWVK